MAKVYVVYSMYHEHDNSYEDVYSSESMERIFDSEEKAINYIREKIKDDHKCVDADYPNDEHVFKYYPDDDAIRQSMSVMSFEYKHLTYMCMCYRWVPYVVE